MARLQLGKDEVMALLGRAARVRQETPVGAAGRGAAAGLAATALLSVLSRITLPVWQRAGRAGSAGGGGAGRQRGGKPPPPRDPFDRDQVIEWQNRYDSPAAYPPGGGRAEPATGDEGAATVSPAGALAQSQAAGPEGIAAEFARKLAAGMFNVDISPYAQAAGEAVHFSYGTAWGAVYGLLQGSYRRPPGPFGVLFGFAVWLLGPALLVPAMRLMPPPPKERPVRLAMMVAGHLIYGLAVAATFEALEREVSY